MSESKRVISVPVWLAGTTIPMVFAFLTGVSAWERNLREQQISALVDRMVRMEQRSEQRSSERQQTLLAALGEIKSEVREVKKKSEDNRNDIAELKGSARASRKRIR